MCWARLIPAVAACVLIGSGGSGWAESVDQAERRLNSGRPQLNERQRTDKGQAIEGGQLQAERERINQNLLETAREIQQKEGQLTGIEARLGELEAQEKLLRGSLAQRHDSIARLLAAMQRMGRNPPPVMITKREDALRMVRSAMLLATAFPKLRDEALILAERLGELARVMGEHKGATDRLRAEATSISEQRTRLSALMEAKRQSLSERQAELEKVRRETAEIAKTVKDLGELITRLDRAVPGRTAAAPAMPAEASVADPAPSSGHKPEAAKPDVTASADLALRPTITPAPADPTPPAASVEPKPGEPWAGAVELAPNGPQPHKRDFARIEPAIPFTQARGRLPPPAQGRRVLAFGDKTQYGSLSKGIVLETRHAAQVTSPTDGWVIFAGEFRTFGQLLIIDAGGGYHILLAGLSHIDVQPRQFVLAGEPVGVMTGAPRSAALKATDTAPVLYVEFRKDNKSIDPDPWWLAQSSQKVQG